MTRNATVYVVHWPDFDIIKVGFSEVRRWKRFEFSGAKVARLFKFESTTDAYHIESWLHDDARKSLRPAFASAEERARELLGNKGSGWAECYLGTVDDANRLVEGSLHRAHAQAHAQASDRALPLEQWHERTYERTHGEQWSPGRDNSSFVTRGRAYGIEVWS